jgi:hypothetical protein
VQSFVTSVPSGTDDAVEATTAVTTARATTDRQRVVPQQERARVIQPRKQAPPTAAVSQDPAAAPLVLQELKHVVLGLPLWVRHPRGGGYPGAAPSAAATRASATAVLRPSVETLASRAAEHNYPCLVDDRHSVRAGFPELVLALAAKAAQLTTAELTERMTLHELSVRAREAKAT